MPDLHGWTSIEVAFGSTTIGVIVDLIIGRAGSKQFLQFPLTAALALIMAFIVWHLVMWLLPIHLGDTSSELLGDAFSALVGTWFGRNSACLGRGEPNHKRGTLLGSALGRLSTMKPGASNRLTLAGLPVYPEDETKHFKLIGTTGTGKSTAIRELLAKALDRGDRAVIADPDFSYADRFYDKNRGDVISNPFDPRGARWDLFAEMATLYDADQLARSLIVDTEGS
jgi:type IV secretion system coupling TraD/TrwB family protein